MRKYIYSIFLLGLFSCQEEGVVQYTQEKDGLQFSANSSEDMTKVFNFATATYEEEINGEPKTFYYGDSLAAYTFERVVLDLQGFPTPDEREYKLKTVLVEDQDSSKVAEVVFEPYYSLAPNQLKDTIKIPCCVPRQEGPIRSELRSIRKGRGRSLTRVLWKNPYCAWISRMCMNNRKVGTNVRSGSENLTKKSMLLW